jgi:hypothetical protein
MRRLVLLAFVTAALAGGANAQDQPGTLPQDRPTIFDLRLGEPVSAQPTRYQEYACGTNGGPPSIALKGFAEFAKCPIEAETGLHEVQFRYNDEAEYWALAMELPPLADRFGGTKIGTYPVIVSALFDDAGILRGYRGVTDDRASNRLRRVAYSMPTYVKPRYGANGWTCEDFPLESGETPVGRNFVKQNCETVTPEGWTIYLQSRLLHRRGQSAIDPNSGEVRQGYYESTARVEVFDAAYVRP